MNMWDSILNVWNKACVPEVKLEPYSANTVYRKGVWFDLTEHKKQIDFDSRPIDETAYSLLKLKGFEQEYIIAFKILAFMKMHNSPTANKISGLAEKVLSKKGVPKVGNWRGSAHYILPIIFNEDDFGLLAPYKIEEITNITTLVEQAAKLWSGIANTVSLLEPPLLLTNNTEVDVFSINTRYEQCPLICDRNQS